jgi:hypothetical protein
MRLSTRRLVALVAGFVVALFGVGVYEAWWTTAFAAGGLAVALAPREMASRRSIVFGAAITGAALLGGMSLFLLYGAAFGAAWWLIASIASLLAATALALLAWRIGRATSRDIAQR